MRVLGDTFAAGAICDSLCTSVTTGTPSSSLMVCSISSPFLSPGPRKLLKAERFALSNEALKMYGMTETAFNFETDTEKQIRELKEHYNKFHTQYVNELFTEMTKVNHE